MKKLTGALFLAIIAVACNNQTKDSVESADSANRANIDSPATQQTIVADEATSSFLVRAADGGMTEVQLGEMGQQKATNQRVKDFAAMMVQDHTAANTEVKTLAGQRNVVLPSAVSEENKKDIDNLTSKTGKDFDKAFMRQMVDDHQATISLFEKAANDVGDTDVKNMINNTLPKLRAHLDSAKAVQKALR